MDELFISSLEGAFNVYFCTNMSLDFSLCSIKLLVSIRIFGKASQYVKEEVQVTKERSKTERIYNPSWSFEPMSSVQEIHGGFNGDIRLFASKADVLTKLD